MKRDLDYCREILLEIERSSGIALNIWESSFFNALDEPNGIQIPADEKEDEKFLKLIFHIQLLLDAEFPHIRVFQGTYLEPKTLKLSWSGADLLDAIRDEKTWKYYREKYPLHSLFELESSIRTAAENKADCEYD